VRKGARKWRFLLGADYPISKLTVSTSGDGLDGGVTEYAYVKNTGETASAHVVQVWAESPKDMAVTRPSK
jgi:hypothetical protein